MSSRARRIVATIGTMGAVGAERVLSVLANGWAARGDVVTLITLDDAPSFYALHESVERLGLGLTGAARGPFRRAHAVARRARALRAAVAEARPDVCLSFIDRHNVLVIAATRGLGVPVVVSERIHPGPLDPPGWSMLRQLAYRSADAIGAQTERTVPGVSPRAWASSCEAPARESSSLRGCPRSTVRQSWRRAYVRAIPTPGRGAGRARTMTRMGEERGTP